MKYRFFPHTADLKFRAYGKTPEEAFSNCVIAIAKSVCRDELKDVKRIKLKVSGKDYENLLYNFLEEILFLIDSKNFFASGVSGMKIDRKNLRLSCELTGDSGEKHKVYSHIKSVTYSEMFVKKEKGKWVVQVVLDI